jgi:radical SAM superfamily enzyme
MMLETASKAYEWGIDSVKYHPLYVVKNTLLANDLRRGRFKAIELEEYLSVLTEALKMKPEDISVQRVSAGIDDDTLLAPEWCGMEKNRIMSIIRKRLSENSLVY